MEYKIIFGAIVVPIHIDRKKSQVYVLVKERVDPDGLDDGKLEAVAETFEPDTDKNIYETALRGCCKELGLPRLQLPLLNGGGAKFLETNGDSVICEFTGFQPSMLLIGSNGQFVGPGETFTDEVSAPYCGCHELVGDKSLNAEVYIGLFLEMFTPRENAESRNFEWIAVEDLDKQLRTKSSLFSFTRAPLAQVCQDIIKKKIEL